MDKIFINTSGIGLIPHGVDVSAHNARPEDLLIINGPVGDHGMAILSKREGLKFDSPLVSDSAPLNALVSSILEVSDGIHVLRDPTRGGVATALNEVAQQSQVGIRLQESSLPVRAAVSVVVSFNIMVIGNPFLAPRSLIGNRCYAAMAIRGTAYC